MRHLKRTAKLGRTSEHRNAMLVNLVRSLIKHRRVVTTLPKAKAARSVAEKMVTLGKRGTREDRRRAEAKLRAPARTLHKSRAQRESWRKNEDIVRILFEEIAPNFKDRPGGYTRIIRMHNRQGDAAQLAMLEWVDQFMEAAPAEEAEPAAKKKADAKAEAKKAAEEAEPKAEAASAEEEPEETPEQAGPEPSPGEEEGQGSSEEPKKE